MPGEMVRAPRATGALLDSSPKAPGFPSRTRGKPRLGQEGKTYAQPSNPKPRGATTRKAPTPQELSLD